VQNFNSNILKARGCYNSFLDYINFSWLRW